jgi:hypothetical protein
MGGVQIVVKQKVHATPLVVLGWDGALELTQRDDRGLLAAYVHDFNCMLIVVLLKDEYAQKLIFLHGFKPWVWKIIYQRIYIPKMCQGLMKMVECMEDEALTHPKGEIESADT